MLKRVLSAAVGLPVFLMFMALNGWWLKGMLAVLALVGLFEAYRAFAGKLTPVHFVGFIFGAAYLLMIDMLSNPSVFTTLICLFTVSAMISPVLFYKRVTVTDAAFTVLGFFYIPVMLSTLYLTRQTEIGSYTVWLCFIAAWGCDTGAFFAGRAFGHNKLAEELSPKKTIEGLVGGVLLATLLAMAFGLLIERFVEIKDVSFPLFCAAAGFFGAILAQFGDLAASVIKRSTNIKDFGDSIPGHGGVLDRFDSVLFTAPAVYVVMTILQYRLR